MNREESVSVILEIEVVNYEYDEPERKAGLERVIVP